MMGQRGVAKGWRGGVLALGLLAPLWASAALGKIAGQRPAADTFRSRVSASLAGLSSAGAPVALSNAVAGAAEPSVRDGGSTRMSHRWTAAPTGDQRTTFESPRPRAEAPVSETKPGSFDTTPIPGVPPVGPPKIATR